MYFLFGNNTSSQRTKKPYGSKIQSLKVLFSERREPPDKFLCLYHLFVSVSQFCVFVDLNYPVDFRSIFIFRLVNIIIIIIISLFNAGYIIRHTEKLV